jgi:zinc transporter
MAIRWLHAQRRAFFAFDVSNVSAVSLWVDRRILVSARVTALRSVDRAAVKAGEIFRSRPNFATYCATGVTCLFRRRDATRMSTSSGTGDCRSGTFSRAKLGHSGVCWSDCAGSLREPAALFRLLSRPPTWISSEDLRDLRQSAEGIGGGCRRRRVNRRIRLIQEEEMVALINERPTARSSDGCHRARPSADDHSGLRYEHWRHPFREHDAGFWIVVVLLAVFISLEASWSSGPPQFLTPYECVTSIG